MIEKNLKNLLIILRYNFFGLYVNVKKILNIYFIIKNISQLVIPSYMSRKNID